MLGIAAIALLPHDPVLLHWVHTHAAQASAVLGAGPDRHYAAAASTYAAGHLLVLLAGPPAVATLAGLAAAATCPRPPGRGLADRS